MLMQFETFLQPVNLSPAGGRDYEFNQAKGGKPVHRLVVAAIITIGAAGGAYAKAHNQGNTEVPGEGVGTQTVAPAQSLGGIKGERPDDKGPDSPGKSSEAGK